MKNKVDLVVDGPASLCLHIHDLKKIGFVFDNKPREWPPDGNSSMQWEIATATLPKGWSVYPSKFSWKEANILDANKNLRIESAIDTGGMYSRAHATAYKRLKVENVSPKKYGYHLRDRNVPYPDGHSLIVCTVTPDENIIQQIPKGHDPNTSHQRKADLLTERFLEATVEKYLPGFKDDITLYWGQNLTETFLAIQTELNAKTPRLNAELEKLITEKPSPSGIYLSGPLKNIL